MIFVCGDTHGYEDIDKLSSKNWPEGKLLTKDDYLIILGDTGLVWDTKSSPREKRLLEWYNKKPWTTLFIDGNHENFYRLFSNEFGNVSKFGSTAKQISDSIFYLKRGNIYRIDYKRIFAFGGGESIDKERRLMYFSWWPQEIPSYGEMDKAIEQLKRYNNDVDIILTHSCSSLAFGMLTQRADIGYKRDAELGLRPFFDWIERNVKYKQWHFGHYHDDFKLDYKHFLHFENRPMQIT